MKIRIHGNSVHTGYTMILLTGAAGLTPVSL